MIKQLPLWNRLYFDAAYVEIARLIGYQGTTYRDMLKMLEPLEQQFGKQRVHSAVYCLVFFEGQMTCNPKPLAEVKLRPEVRRLCWQLLGPPPEQREAFMTNSDGSSRNPKQATPKQEMPPKEKSKPVRKERSAREPRKKKPVRDKPTEKPIGDIAQASHNSRMMEQFQAAKEKHPDMVLLFRIGDFYELFGEDAEEASKLLGLTLTTRDRTQTMAGFPHHCLESYLQKLLQEGKRVAVCDQIEDPLAQAPIKREVQLIVTPETDEK